MTPVSSCHARTITATWLRLGFINGAAALVSLQHVVDMICSDQSGQLLRRAQLSKFRPLVTFTGFRFRAVTPSVHQSAAAASC